MTDWPYDADQRDPLAELRIPVVRTPYPGWKYEVCVMISDPADTDPLYGPSLRPDERETAQIVAYIDYRMAWYNAGWRAKMRERPLDTDGTTNTVVLRKRADGGWCYRRWSWTMGPLMVPAPDGEALTLEALLDRINDLVPDKWAAHKAKYPEAFGEVTADAEH
jgi:hypothetical protein